MLWGAFIPVESVKSDIYMDKSNEIIALRIYEDAPVPFSSHSYVFGAASQNALIQLERNDKASIYLVKERGKSANWLSKRHLCQRSVNILYSTCIRVSLSFANIGKIDCATRYRTSNDGKRAKWNFHFHWKNFTSTSLKFLHNVYNCSVSNKTKTDEGWKINFAEENQGAFTVKPGVLHYQKTDNVKVESDWDYGWLFGFGIFWPLSLCGRLKWSCGITDPDAKNVGSRRKAVVPVFFGYCR